LLSIKGEAEASGVNLGLQNMCGLGFFGKRSASANNSAAAVPAVKSKKQTDYKKREQDIVIYIPAQEC